MKKGSTNSVRTTRNEHSHKDFWLMVFSQTSQNEVNQMAMALIIQTLVIFHSEKKKWLPTKQFRQAITTQAPGYIEYLSL